MQELFWTQEVIRYCLEIALSKEVHETPGELNIISGQRDISLGEIHIVTETVNTLLKAMISKPPQPAPPPPPPAQAVAEKSKAPAPTDIQGLTATIASNPENITLALNAVKAFQQDQEKKQASSRKYNQSQADSGTDDPFKRICKGCQNIFSVTQKDIDTETPWNAKFRCAT